MIHALQTPLFPPRLEAHLHRLVLLFPTNICLGFDNILTAPNLPRAQLLAWFRARRLFATGV